MMVLGCVVCIKDALDRERISVGNKEVFPFDCTIDSDVFEVSYNTRTKRWLIPAANVVLRGESLCLKHAIT